MKSPLMLLASLLALSPVAGADDVDAWRKDLRSTDSDRAMDAAEKLAEDPSPRALDVLLDELSVGAPPRIQGVLLAGLEKRKDPHAVDVLAYYARGRTPDLRKRAVVALGKIEDPRVGPLLVQALADPAREVRAASARSLGERKDKSAAEALLKLLKRGDESAVEPLGTVAGPVLVRDLGELLRQNLIPFSMLADTLGIMLKRADLGPDPIRLEVVTLLGKIPGNDATGILKEYLNATAGDKALPSRVAAEKAIAERESR